MNSIHQNPVFWQALVKRFHLACLLILTFISSVAQAQDEYEEQQDPTPGFKLPTYTERFDTLFRGNRDRIPHGILYDRVYPFAALDKNEPCDTLKDAYDIFQAWSEAERSAYTPITGIAYSEMRHQTDMLHLQNRIAAIAVDVNMATIDTNAFNDGRLIITPDSFVIDAGKESPYTSFRAQRVGLSKTELYTDIRYTIVFDHTFILSNNETKADRLKIKLPNGEVVVLTPNEEYTFELTKLLEGEWTLTLESDDDPTDICNTIIMNPIGPYYPQAIGNCTEGEKWIIESDIPFRGYLESDYTTSLANAHVYYHLTPGNQCKIMKPVIILDGFDPEDKRPYNRIYRGNLRYTKGQSTHNLGNDLRHEGYDVIILNFPVLGDKEALNGRSDVKLYDPKGTFLKKVDRKGRDGGADYIERNAFLLVKLIQEVNAKLKANGSHEKLVVVGPSMGGLISRYALAYMEARDDEGKPNMEHNCRLWMSFDSPHQGANISAGTQYSTEFFSENLKKVEQQDLYHKTLRSVAARQMLVLSTPSYYGTMNFRSTLFKKEFKNALTTNGLTNSSGYPDKTRNVSLLNGTLNGTRDFKPAQFDVFIEAKKAGLQVFKFITRTAPDNGKDAIIFEYFQRHAIKISKKIKLPGGSIASELTLTNNRPELFQDSDQGSYYQQTKKLSELVNKTLKDEGVNNIKVYYDNLDFTFITSFSALDIDKNKYLNINANLQNTDLVCEGSTPFDAYYVPNKNQPHIYLDEDNVEWALAEISKGRPGCEGICPEVKTWNNAICNGSRAAFELGNLPKNKTYGIHWTADTKLFSFVGSRTDAKAVVEANNKSNQYSGFVRATVLLPCAPNKVFEREVIVPSTKAEIKGVDQMCQGTLSKFEMNTETTAFNFRWYFGDANGIYQNGSPYHNMPAPKNSGRATTHKNTGTFGGERSGIYTLYGEAYNQCQERITASKQLSVLPRSHCNKLKNDTGEAELLYLYPNPSRSAWTLQLPPSAALTVAGYRLYDQTGRLLLHEQPKKAFVEVPGERLTNGQYLLQIQLSNGTFLQKKLIKY